MGVQIQRFELTAEDKSAAAFESMKRRVQDMIGSVGSLGGAFQLMAGGFSVGIFSKLIDNSIKAMDELHKLSMITGQSVESLSAMRSAAKESGVEFEGVAKASTILSKNMLEIARGGGKAQATFEELGLSVKDSNGQLKSSDQMMLEVAKSLAGMTNETQRVAYAQQLFGKAGATILPFLMSLAERGLDNAKVTKQQAAEAHKFEVAITKMQSASKAWFMHLASELLPTLTKLLDLVKPMAIVLGTAFAAFVVVPAIIGPAIAAFQTVAAAVTIAAEAFAAGKVAQGFAAMNMMLGGTSAFALAASGAVGALTVASGLLIAAWAGWELGSWAQRNFLEARLFGIDFIGAMMKGWEYLKYGAQVAWLGIKEGFWTIIGSMQNKLAGFLELFAKGLSMLPGMSGPAAFINEVSASLRSAADRTGEFARAQASLKAELDKNLSGVTAITTEMEDYEISQIKVEQAVKKNTNAVAIQTKAADDSTKAYEALIKQIQERIAVNTLELQSDTALTEGQKLAAKVMVDLRDGVLKLTDAQKIFLAKSLEELIASDKAIQAQKDLATAREEQRKALEAYEQNWNNYLQGLENESRTLQEQIDFYGMTTGQIAAARQARAEETLAIATANGVMDDYLERMKREVDLRRQIAGQQSLLDTRKAADELQRQIQAEAKKTVDTIDHDVQHGFVRMFDKLGGGWDGFLKAMASSFKKLVADQIYMFFARPIVLQIIAGTAGSLGLTSVANAAMTSAGLAGAATSSSGLGVASNGLSIANSLMGGGGSLFSALGTSSMLSGTGFGAGLQYVGANGVLGGLGSAGTFLGAGEFGLAAGAAIPAVGLALAAYGLLNSLGVFGGKSRSATAQFGGLGAQSTITQAGGFSGTQYTAYGSSPTDIWGGSVHGALSADMLSAFNQAIGKVFSDMTASAKSVGLTVTGIESLIVHMGATGQGVQADMQTALGSMVEQIAQQLIPNLKDYQAGNESLAQTYDRLVSDAKTVKAVFDALGKTFPSVNEGIVSISEQLIATFGSASNLSSAFTAYYNAMYTQAEKDAQDAAKISDVFSAMGLAAPSTRSAFRSIVEGLDLTSAAGRDTFAVLLAIAPAFARLADAATSATTAVDILVQQVGDMQNAAQEAVDAQISASQAASQAARQSADAFRQIAASMLEAVRQLRGGDLSPLLPGQKLSEATGNLDATFAKAMLGDSASLSALPQLATDFLTASRNYNASSAAYTSDFNKVMDMLARAGISSTAQATAADHTALVLDAQLVVLGSIKTELAKPSPDSAILATQAKLLGDISGYSDGQLQTLVSSNVTQSSSLVGINTGVDKVVVLLQQWITLQGQAGAAAAQAAAQAAADQAKADAARAAAKAAADAAANAAALAAAQAAKLQSDYTNALATLQTTTGLISNWAASNGGAGITNTPNVATGTAAIFNYPAKYAADMDRLMGQYWQEWSAAVSAYQALPKHAMGLDRVPYDGYRAELHADEAVLTSAQAASWRNGGAAISTADLASLRSDLREIRTAVQNVAAISSRDVKEQTARLAAAVEDSAVSMGRTVARAQEAATRA